MAKVKVIEVLSLGRQRNRSQFKVNLGHDKIQIHVIDIVSDFTGCSRIPEGMKEGKEMAAGTRIPPSHVVPFPEICSL